MYFDIMGDITGIEIIASGRAVRDRALLNERYGTGRWRKLKGYATVRLTNGQIRQAEIHWYEAQNIGRRRFKIKRFLD